MYDPERAMLRAVHEWVRDNPPANPLVDEIEMRDWRIATLVSGGEYVNPYAEYPDAKQPMVDYQQGQIALFRSLVDGKLIDAKVHTVEPGQVFALAIVRGLTPSGLQKIR